MNPRSVRRLDRPLYSVPIPLLMRHAAGRQREAFPWGLVAFLVLLACGAAWGWWPVLGEVAP